MEVRTLTLAAICVATCMSASIAFAGTYTASTDDDTTVVFGSAKLSNLQDVGGSAKAGASTVSIGADVLRGASGNIGVNLAAGALNAQANQVALITTPQTQIASRQNVHAVAQLAGSGTAALGAGAMTNLSGNVGVNIAAGASNAQFNGLVVH